MGDSKFGKYLGVLLTDRAPEFNDYHRIEFDNEISSGNLSTLPPNK